MARWKVLAESVAGTSHRASALPCQDAFRTALCGPNERILAVVLADGAGSATYADAGATLTCDTLLGLIRNRLANGLTIAQYGREVVLADLYEVRTALFREAERRGCPLRELACTVLLAIVGHDTAAFAQLGDGAIVVCRTDCYEPVFWPQEGEYANATNFLTDDDFAAAVEAVVLNEPVREFAAFTDGLQRLALEYRTRSGHAGFFRPLLQRLRTAPNPEELMEPFRQFLDSPRINDRTDDDKTLVLATRLTPDEPTAETR